MEAAGEIEEEVEFLRRVWKRHLKRTVRRVLDVACGNSPHGQIMARSGIEVAGVDRSPTMIAQGKQEARGLPLEILSTADRQILYSREQLRLRDSSCQRLFPVMVSNPEVRQHLKSVRHCAAARRNLLCRHRPSRWRSRGEETDFLAPASNQSCRRARGHRRISAADPVARRVSFDIRTELQNSFR